MPGHNVSDSVSELISNSGRLVRNLWLQAECLGHIVLQLFWIPLVVHFASQPISVSGARFDCIPQFVIGASSLGAGPDHAASAGQHTADDVVPGMGGIADGTREDILSIVFGGRITRSRNLSRALSEIKWECDILHSPGGSAPKWGGRGFRCREKRFTLAGSIPNRRSRGSQGRSHQRLQIADAS